MGNSSERPNRIPWPPLLYIAAAGIAIYLSYTLPAPWLPSPLSDFIAAVGAVLLFAGVLIMVVAARTLMKHKTTVLPTSAASRLVTSGPYSFSRNPIYLADTLIVIGIGTMFGLLWFYLLALVAALLTNELAIKPEERHLAARFHKAWYDYSKKVRRWI